MVSAFSAFSGAIDGEERGPAQPSASAYSQVFHPSTTQARQPFRTKDNTACGHFHVLFPRLL